MVYNLLACIKQHMLDKTVAFSICMRSVALWQKPHFRFYAKKGRRFTTKKNDFAMPTSK